MGATSTFPPNLRQRGATGTASAATMVKIGESFPPEHFFKFVFGIWVLIQMGVLVTLWVRRRQAALEKQD